MNSKVVKWLKRQASIRRLTDKEDKNNTTQTPEDKKKRLAFPRISFRKRFGKSSKEKVDTESTLPPISISNRLSHSAPKEIESGYRDDDADSLYSVQTKEKYRSTSELSFHSLYECPKMIDDYDSDKLSNTELHYKHISDELSSYDSNEFKNDRINSSTSNGILNNTKDGLSTSNSRPAVSKLHNNSNGKCTFPIAPLVKMEEICDNLIDKGHPVDEKEAKSDELVAAKSFSGSTALDETVDKSRYRIDHYSNSCTLNLNTIARENECEAMSECEDNFHSDTDLRIFEDDKSIENINEKQNDELLSRSHLPKAPTLIIKSDVEDTFKTNPQVESNIKEKKLSEDHEKAKWRTMTDEDVETNKKKGEYSQENESSSKPIEKSKSPSNDFEGKIRPTTTHSKFGISENENQHISKDNHYENNSDESSSSSEDSLPSVMEIKTVYASEDQSTLIVEEKAQEYVEQKVNSQNQDEKSDSQSGDNFSSSDTTLSSESSLEHDSPVKVNKMDNFEKEESTIDVIQEATDQAIEEEQSRVDTIETSLKDQTSTEEYPEELNPFGDDLPEDEMTCLNNKLVTKTNVEVVKENGADHSMDNNLKSIQSNLNARFDVKHINLNQKNDNEVTPEKASNDTKSLNPFDESDEEDRTNPLDSTNPFNEDSDEPCVPVRCIDTPPRLPPKSIEIKSRNRALATSIPVPRPRKTKSPHHGSYTSLQNVCLYPIPAPRTTSTFGSTNTLNESQSTNPFDDEEDVQVASGFERCSVRMGGSTSALGSFNRAGVRGSLPLSSKYRRKARPAPLPPGLSPSPNSKN